MATTLKTIVTAQIDATYRNLLDLSTPVDTISERTKIALASGTGANSADLMFHDQRTLTASATEAGRAANEEQREKARKKDPKVFQALNLSESFVQPVIPDETPQESAQRIQDYDERYFDKSNKSSASQRRDLIREAEFIAQPPPSL